MPTKEVVDEYVKVVGVENVAGSAWYPVLECALSVNEIKWLPAIPEDVWGCAVLGRGAEPPQFWVLLIWLEPGISHVTWVHYDATMCLACFVRSILPVLHFLQFDLCVL